MARTIDFFDGAESGTVPTLGNIIADNLATYADDATYEANVQGAPFEGNIYFNTTDKKVRYYTGSGWVEVVDESSPQTLQNKTIDGTSATGNNTVTADASDITHDPSGNSFVATDQQAMADEAAGRLDGHDGDITDVRSSLGISDGDTCLLYTSPSPRDGLLSRMPSSA